MSAAGDEKMAQGPQQHRLGEHWGVNNPIPTVQDFVTNMNKSQHARPSKPDDPATVQHHQQRADAIEHGDVLEHEERKVHKDKLYTVTDPTTGKEIEVEDQGKDSLDAVKNPTVSIPPDENRNVPKLTCCDQLNVPNANLGKPTVSFHCTNPLESRLCSTDR